jgi:hypothetical protein
VVVTGSSMVVSPGGRGVQLARWLVGAEDAGREAVYLRCGIFYSDKDGVP